MPIVTGLVQVILELHSAFTHLSKGTGRTALGSSSVECLQLHGTGLDLSLPVAKTSSPFQECCPWWIFSRYSVRHINVLEGPNVIKMVCQVVFLFPKLEDKRASRNSGGVRSASPVGEITAIEMFASVRSISS